VTSLLDGLVAFLVAVMSNAFLLARVRRLFPAGEAPFLLRVYLWGLILRFAGSIFVNAYAGSSLSFAEMFWGDSYTYDEVGLLLARSWSGDALGIPPAQQMVSGYGFAYYVAVVYFIFGRNELLVQFLNGTISASAILVIYAIAREGRRRAAPGGARCGERGRPRQSGNEVKRWPSLSRLVAR
jgi:hypothetical protein